MKASPSARPMGTAARLASLFVLFMHGAGAAECNGHATPGPRNTLPIDTAKPEFVRAVPNGKLFTAGPEGDRKDVVHLWGSPYENGAAMGALLGPKIQRFFAEVYKHVEEGFVKELANATWCEAHAIRCEAVRAITKMGLRTALDLSYRRTAPFLKSYVMEELQGLADAIPMSLVDIRNAMWLGEVTRGACSMFGANGRATAHSLGGALLQLRALDWDVDGPFRNYPTVTVYHPPADNATEGAGGGRGHAWANVGFAGWMASITGYSSRKLGLSEIGVSFPDESFGPETYLARGYPFGFLIRDVLQFDRTLEEATTRITSATRTCDLLLGVGDGKSHDFSGFQYSPKAAVVVKPTSLKPVNASWHPPIDDVVYWGMDWICPNDNRMLADALRRHHGRLSAATTISDVTSYVRTGDLHIAIYDYANDTMYVATARQDGGSGPLVAYQRQFTALDMAALWAVERPSAEELGHVEGRA